MEQTAITQTMPHRMLVSLNVITFRPVVVQPAPAVVRPALC
jgi:hypothetical protein